MSVAAELSVPEGMETDHSQHPQTQSDPIITELQGQNVNEHQMLGGEQ